MTLSYRPFYCNQSERIISHPSHARSPRLRALVPRRIMERLEENLCSGNTQYSPISVPASGIGPLATHKKTSILLILFLGPRTSSTPQLRKPDLLEEIYRNRVPNLLGGGNEDKTAKKQLSSK